MDGGGIACQVAGFKHPVHHSLGLAVVPLWDGCELALDFIVEHFLGEAGVGAESVEVKFLQVVNCILDWRAKAKVHYWMFESHFLSNRLKLSLSVVEQLFKIFYIFF
jgi:hypothetical protein